MADLHAPVANERTRPLELDLDLAAQVHDRSHAELVYEVRDVARREALQVVGPQEHAARRDPAAGERQPPEVANVRRALQRDPP